MTFISLIKRNLMINGIRQIKRPEAEIERINSKEMSLSI